MMGMKKLRKALMYPLWRLYAGKERNMALNKDTSQPLYIVMGFQRSGTSLICDMLNACGVYFGEKRDLMRPDDRNPNGFYEHNTIFEASRSFLKQAGYPDDMYYDRDLRAKGALNKIARTITRSCMMSVLSKLNQNAFAQNKPFGFKSFPLFFYFWKKYLPNYKIVAVYRDPMTVAHGFMKAWPQGKYTFDQVLEHWTKSNRDLLYHTSVVPSLVIQYEDLFDSAKKSKIAQEIVKFVGQGNPTDVEALIQSDLNRSGAALEALRSRYPFDARVKAVMEALESVKFKA